MTITLMLGRHAGAGPLNVPIAVALAFVAMLAICSCKGRQCCRTLALVMFDGASSFPLLAIPLFIWPARS